MIRYALRCDRGHDFDGWFRSSSSFDASHAAGHVACTHCGSSRVSKMLMAPAVSVTKSAVATRREGEDALRALRKQIEANSDYVGLEFVDEARAMHEGRSPARAIHGEARLDEARKLVEEGVPVAPLPFMPRQKSN